ncbi:MAG TPA: decarboxylase, partial [Candidatus Ventrisoma faecale]|nr:decarboxylase [Candidatus Ventrisoma faecale]
MGKSLYDRLREYGTSDVYPFHMPGHKRRMGGNGPAALERPYEIDLTEIGWNDNLHHAEGILKESMEMAANVYGADRSYYLVNGSTCGILSAVSAAARSGGRILMARNCHKSAYHGVILNHLRAEYVYPQNLWEFGVYGGLLADDIAKLVDNCPDICAILLTSPTYEGIVSDIGEISVICHRRGIPLIVDEAHGAHFTFGDNFPKSAVECGADLVIQSLHKTLPSLTQTAILHVQGDMIDREKLERYLKIYQTSSPSYVFLASMENCIRYMDGPGRSGMERFGERVRTLTGELEGLRTMKVLNDSVIGKNGVFDRDPSKIVITAPGAG